MSLSMGYLTPKQKLVWRLRSEGFTEAGIGRKLKIKRQAVHEDLNVTSQEFKSADPAIIRVFVATEVIFGKKIERR